MDLGRLARRADAGHRAPRRRHRHRVRRTAPPAASRPLVDRPSPRPGPPAGRWGTATTTTRCSPRRAASSTRTSPASSRSSTCRCVPTARRSSSGSGTSCSTIGYGETATYGEIAGRLGMNAGASRAVGMANGRNPIGIVIPCHRVVGADGTLTGYAGGVERKQALLDLEQDALF